MPFSLKVMLPSLDCSPGHSGGPVDSCFKVTRKLGCQKWFLFSSRVALTSLCRSCFLPDVSKTKKWVFQIGSALTNPLARSYLCYSLVVRTGAVPPRYCVPWNYFCDKNTLPSQSRSSHFSISCCVAEQALHPRATFGTVSFG